jgi:hypothetical protein
MSALRQRQETSVGEIGGSPNGVRSGSDKKRRNLYRSGGVVFDTRAVGINGKWPRTKRIQVLVLGVRKSLKNQGPETIYGAPLGIKPDFRK